MPFPLRFIRSTPADKMTKTSILIIDDEPTLRASVQHFLSQQGYLVSQASSGLEAMRLVEANPPDVALLDISMPGFDGLETLKGIKSIHPETIVIMVSGLKDETA